MLVESRNYLQRLDDLRRQVLALVQDLPAEALNWRPVEGSDDHATNSLAVLAAHVAGAEHFWIAEVIGGFPPTRDRAGEFALQVADISELTYRLEKTSAETQAVLEALTEADLSSTREREGRQISVRWALLHVIEHSALHLGHMQITYQLWMGGQSKQSPRWYERLKVDD